MLLCLTSWSVSSRDLASSVVGARGDTTTVRGAAVMAGRGAASPSYVVYNVYCMLYIYIVSRAGDGAGRSAQRAVVAYTGRGGQTETSGDWRLIVALHISTH